jgi:Ca2+-binding EF-hand superfamily protein
MQNSNNPSHLSRNNSDENKNNLNNSDNKNKVQNKHNNTNTGLPKQKKEPSSDNSKEKLNQLRNLKYIFPFLSETQSGLKEEENKIKNSQNQGQNEEQKEEIEPPKEEIKEEQNEEQNEEPKEEQKEEPKENINKNEYENYEQNQFNEFMKKLMKVESQIEETKNNLGKNPDFNCEDAFRLFESNNKGYLELIDIKNGLNSLGINPTEQELNLLMKRFDLQKNKFINYADFFDMVVPFEKNLRQEIENRQPNLGSPEAFNEKTFNDLKGLFELIIKTESDINNDRKTLGTLRLKLKDIFALLDKNGKGYFDIDEMMVYFANNGILDNNKEADLLFIRLDKNRNGKIDYNEVEDELQTLF